MSEWPWSALGIAETADKDAIRAAYQDRRDALDRSMSISAFARLTEAREKALFLASEIDRAAQRGERLSDQLVPPAPPVAAATQAGGSVPEPPPPVVRSAPTPSTPILPEGDEAGTAANAEDEPFHDTDDVETGIRPWVSVPASARAAEPVAEAEAAVEIEDAAQHAEPFTHDEDAAPVLDAPSRYRTDLDRDLAAFAEAWTDARSRLARAMDEVSTKEQQEKLIRRWPLALVLFIGFCSIFDGDREEESGVTTAVVAVPNTTECRQENGRRVCTQTITETLGPPMPERDAMVADLFGNEMRYADLEKINPTFTRGWFQSFQPGELSDARGVLRAKILSARRSAPAEDVLAINRLYLAWLQQSRQAGGSQCLEVASWAFFDDVPQMPPERVAEEQRLLRKLANRYRFAFESDRPEDFAVPPDLLEEAATTLNMRPAEALAALSDFSDPANCDVRIHLLQTMLDDPARRSRQLFRRM